MEGDDEDRLGAESMEGMFEKSGTAWPVSEIWLVLSSSGSESDVGESNGEAGPDTNRLRSGEEGRVSRVYISEVTCGVGGGWSGDGACDCGGGCFALLINVEDEKAEAPNAWPDDFVIAADVDATGGGGSGDRGGCGRVGERQRTSSRKINGRSRVSEAMARTE